MFHHHELRSLKRNLTITGFLSVTVLLAAIWLVGLYPHFSSMRELTNQQKTLERGLSNQTVLHSKYLERLADLEHQQSIAVSLASRVPATARESDFMGLISEIASQTNVTITNFRPQSSQTGKDIGISQVRISGNGSYGDIIGFLNQLRLSPRMNRIVQFDLSPMGDPRERYKLDLTLNLYFNLPPTLVTSRVE